MDLFDDVLLLEGNASAKGAVEGEIHGQAEGRYEGWRAGTAAGAAAGVELGFYYSCAASWHRDMTEKAAAAAAAGNSSAKSAGNSRLCFDLSRIQTDIEAVLQTDPATDAFADQLEKVHALFRKLAVNMGLPELAPARGVTNRDELDF